MRLRRLCQAASAPALLIAAAALAVGCGGVSSAVTGQGDQLTVYSSLPLQGPSAHVSQQLVDGEKLALRDWDGRIGRFQISYDSLSDASPTTGQWDPGITAGNAKIAADDPSTIAYLGDYNSAATAISLPLMNAADVLQVSPASPYGGLTSSSYAGQDEPERFYPTGRRSFARLQPGDGAQARAQVALMRRLKVAQLYVIDDQDPFLAPLAQMVVALAQRAGIHVPAHDSIDTTAATSFAGEVAKVRESGAQAVFFAGGTTAETVALWRQLHAADPRLWLLGSSTMVNAGFTAAIGSGAGARTLLSTPVLPVGDYPPQARPILVAYARQFHERPTAYALYGYAAMSAVLRAIARARAHGDDRQAVVRALFAAPARETVIGRYAIDGDGETTLSTYGVDRVRAGQPVFWRVIGGV